MHFFFFETKAVAAKNLFSLIRCTAKKTRIDQFKAKLIFLCKLEKLTPSNGTNAFDNENVFKTLMSFSA